MKDKQSIPRKDLKIILTKAKESKYDKIIAKGLDKEMKADKVTKEERVELKSYAIKKALKIKKYVRN